MRITNPRFIPALILGLSSLFIGNNLALAQTGPTDGISKIHSVTSSWANGPTYAPTVLLATDFGLLRSEPDGLSTQISGLEAVVTSLVNLPGQPDKLLISGYGKDQNPLGIMQSNDGGKSWEKVSTDAEPVALRSLAISAVDPALLMGIMGGLQISRDGGKTWQASGNLPDQTFRIAPSSQDKNTIFAATMTGLMKSTDAGETWSSTYPDTSAATVVSTLKDGKVFAFIYGKGLISAREPDLQWQTLSANFEDRYLLNLVGNPANSDMLIATADTGAILLSGDRGNTWRSFEGSNNNTPERLARGREIFESTCSTCHGVGGIGESPDDPAAKDEFGYKAPALNNDMHAWHHSDAGIKATVSNGSPRNPRMVAFKEIYTEQDIDSVIAYVKSFWTVRSLACQGGRHMGCLGK